MNQPGAWQTMTKEQWVRFNELRELHRAYTICFKKRGAAKTVLNDLMTATVNEPKMLNIKHPHPEMLAIFREGRRSIGQHIAFMLDPMNFTEDAFHKNLKEG